MHIIAQSKWSLLMSNQSHIYALVNQLMITILNSKLVILSQYKNIKIFWEKSMSQIGEKKFLWLKRLKTLSRVHMLLVAFFSICVFFHNHSRTTVLQGKGEEISLTPHYHFHPLHRHLDISQAITVESSPLHIGSSRTWTRNLWFPSASC